ncbi:MAG: dihydrofolate reductase family protein, partial [Spirochaetota bacterium]|nr:dihydrofolate reductase family protein [Spirochaetota bacterium]
VMGKNTFNKVVTFGQWPYTKPVYVLTHSTGSVPHNLRDKVEIITAEPQPLVDNLKARGYSNLYIDGGKVIQSFLREDLIDEIIITIVPILLGAGIPLFAGLHRAIRFSFIDCEVLAGQMVKHYYRRDRR